MFPQSFVGLIAMKHLSPMFLFQSSSSSSRGPIFVSDSSYSFKSLYVLGLAAAFR
jgi:hypothetical protein